MGGVELGRESNEHRAVPFFFARADRGGVLGDGGADAVGEGGSGLLSARRLQQTEQLSGTVEIEREQRERQRLQCVQRGLLRSSMDGGPRSLFLSCRPAAVKVWAARRELGKLWK